MVTQADVERVREEIRPQVMVLSIIHLAMMLGGGMYAVFVLSMIAKRDATDIESMDTAWMFIILVVVCAVMSFVIPSLISANLGGNVTWKGDPANPLSQNQNPQFSSDMQIADTPAKALMGAATVTRIVGLALLEGPMFLCSFLASQYSPWWLVGSAILFLLIAIRFPFPRQLAEWIADEEEKLLSSRREV